MALYYIKILEGNLDHKATPLDQGSIRGIILFAVTTSQMHQGSPQTRTGRLQFFPHSVPHQLILRGTQQLNMKFSPVRADPHRMPTERLMSSGKLQEVANCQGIFHSPPLPIKYSVSSVSSPVLSGLWDCWGRWGAQQCHSNRVVALWSGMV